MTEAKPAPTLVPGIPIAFLVDGDNATAALIKPLLDEAGKHGTLIIRRVYGDWTQPTLGKWKRVLQDHALQPIQQFANVSGKNATDSALIIDAMDILHSGRVAGFCIVSSDSDFTRLATRIRDSGLFVIGMGRASTPPAFVNACNVFTAIENLIDEETEIRTPAFDESGTPWMQAGSSQFLAPPMTILDPRTVKHPRTDALPVLTKAYEASVGEAGRVALAALGNTLLRIDPAFDPRTYGCAKLVTLVESFPDDFRVERHPERGPGAINVVRVSQKVQ